MTKVEKEANDFAKRKGNDIEHTTYIIYNSFIAGCEYARDIAIDAFCESSCPYENCKGEDNQYQCYELKRFIKKYEK